MDFFSNQDAARRNTKYLVMLYVLAVCMLIGLANLLIAFCLWFFDGNSIADGTTTFTAFFTWRMLGKVSLGVTAIVACAILFKWLTISSGGKAVAESLGGVRISPNTDNLDQQRILNVVEEMALASGMPVPPVFLLAKERGINAFAAGFTPADAVIGITQGSLDNFNREQLQGVVAHEFSHILNGDMRLNLRLIALLNGILFIGSIGQFIMRSAGSASSRRRSVDIRLVLIGLAMAVVGWLGIFFGGLIKAAINRQREYLADASAVQFTRNPGGIADALKIIGGSSMGSRIVNTAADETSHMFISNALGKFAIFSTHPPLQERIKRIDRTWDGEMIVRPGDHVNTQADPGAAPAAAEKSRATAMAGAAMVMGGVLAGRRDPGKKVAGQPPGALPAGLTDRLHEPLTACAVIYALLLDEKKDILEHQLTAITTNGAQGASSLAAKMALEMKGMDPAWRVILIEKVMPALKSMSLNQYRNFKKVLVLLIRTDEKIDLFEWCLFQLIRHFLGAEFGDRRPSKPRFKTIADVADAYALVLSALVHHGHREPATAQRAFNLGATTGGLYNGSLLAESQCAMEDFSKAADRLADCYPLLKARLLKGLVETARFDGTISVMENELITSIAAAMDAPLPRML
jgi:Zn-dependent protease with chaperone function